MILTMKGADNQVEMRTDAFSGISRNFLEIPVMRSTARPAKDGQPYPMHKGKGQHVVLSHPSK
jgi:hypothetical protein